MRITMLNHINNTCANYIPQILRVKLNDAIVVLIRVGHKEVRRANLVVYRENAETDVMQTEMLRKEDRSGMDVEKAQVETSTQLDLDPRETTPIAKGTRRMAKQLKRLPWIAISPTKRSS
ncbi:hypothetical protein QYF36_017191 [Acer negundo]|nr:hypothetical protein QYF36_017191 [Acer negundo]